MLSSVGYPQILPGNEPDATRNTPAPSLYLYLNDCVTLLQSVLTNVSKLISTPQSCGLAAIVPRFLLVNVGWVLSITSITCLHIVSSPVHQSVIVQVRNILYDPLPQLFCLSSLGLTDILQLGLFGHSGINPLRVSMVGTGALAID